MTKVHIITYRIEFGSKCISILLTLYSAYTPNQRFNKYWDQLNSPTMVGGLLKYVVEYLPKGLRKKYNL